MESLDLLVSGLKSIELQVNIIFKYHPFDAKLNLSRTGLPVSPVEQPLQQMTKHIDTHKTKTGKKSFHRVQ